MKRITTMFIVGLLCLVSFNMAQATPSTITLNVNQVSIKRGMDACPDSTDDEVSENSDCDGTESLLAVVGGSSSGADAIMDDIVGTLVRAKLEMSVTLNQPAQEDLHVDLGLLRTPPYRMAFSNQYRDDTNPQYSVNVGPRVPCEWVTRNSKNYCKTGRSTSVPDYLIIPKGQIRSQAISHIVYMVDMADKQLGDAMYDFYPAARDYITAEILWVWYTSNKCSLFPSVRSFAKGGIEGCLHDEAISLGGNNVPNIEPLMTLPSEPIKIYDGSTITSPLRSSQASFLVQEEEELETSFASEEPEGTDLAINFPAWRGNFALVRDSNYERYASLKKSPGQIRLFFDPEGIDSINGVPVGPSWIKKKRFWLYKLTDSEVEEIHNQ